MLIMSLYTQYNIEGYLPYKKFETNIKIDTESQGIDTNTKIAYDIFEIETFLLCFFVYQFFFKVFVWFASFTPFGFVLYPFAIVLDGYSQALTFALMFTLYMGFMNGYYYRLERYKNDNAIFHPEIHIKFMWRDEVRYLTNMSFTPDVYNNTPQWAYDLYNDYNAITYRTMIKWSYITYHNVRYGLEWGYHYLTK